MKFKLLFIFITSFICVNGQVGIGTPTPDETSILEIRSDNKGVLVPRISLTSKIHKLNTNTNNAHALLVFNIGTILPQGFYYWKQNIVIENSVTTDQGSWIAIGSEVASMPKFFYMPSVVLPTTQDQVTALNNSNITHENGVFTVDLYALFKAQFDAPIKSSNAVAATTNPNVSSLSDFVLSRSAYEYHVIYADANVFPHTNISFLTGADNEGKLTYKVNSNAIVDNGSFMNIVLKVK